MDLSQPLALYTDTVRPEWIDYNNHMNVAYYVLAFDFATDAFLEFLGLDQRLRKTHNLSTFSAEAHVTYQRELHQGDPLRFTTQLISFDTKRVHYFHRMFHAEEGYQAATFETLSLCMDMAVRRVGLWPDPILGRLEELGAAQAHLDSPPELGHAIGTPLS
jgi:acyl-CoA thioester hydrolase